MSILLQTPTSELEAVNVMLGVIGETPVNSIEGSGLNEVAVARSVLHEISRAVQTRGWWFNLDEEFELSPTVEGHIALPSNALSVDTSESQWDIDVVERGGKLWNRTTHSFIFDRSVKVDLISFLPFNELPEAARRFITIRAARTYQARMIGSESLDAFSVRDEQDAMTVLEARDANEADHNMLRGSYSVSNILRRS